MVFSVALGFAAQAVTPLHAAGLPDPSFATDGAFVSQQPGRSTVLDGLVDVDGRYVAVGGRILDGTQQGFIIRLTKAGALDETLGGDGDISLAPPPGFTVLELHAVQERPDGRLVVAGHVSPAPDLVDARPIVCRFLAAGVIDVSFGSGGCIMPPFGPLSPEELVSDMALQADGRIVLVGSSKFGQTRRSALMRLLANGDRDLCFDDPGCTTGGAVITPAVGDVVVSLNAVAIAPDQKIVAVGSAVEQSIDMVAIRLLTSGAVDANFGNGGSRSIGFEGGGDNFDRATGVAVLDDGAIVMSGNARIGDDASVAGVAKLTVSGVPDIFFGQSGAGRAVTSYTDVSIDSFANGVAVQPDGKIVVVGTSFMGPNQTNGYFGAWRLLPNGFSDPTFGNFNGRIAITLIENQVVLQFGTTVALDENHVVLMGSRQENGAAQTRAAVLRLDQHGIFADGYE